jgi:hypothetical protein
MAEVSAPMIKVRRIVLRAVALTMAAASKAILQRIDAGGPAKASSSIDTAKGEAEDFPARSSAAEEVKIGNPVMKRVSPGPPEHWLERVRRGAPELLKSLLHRNMRPRSIPGPPSSAPLTGVLAPKFEEASRSAKVTSSIDSSAGVESFAPRSSGAEEVKIGNQVTQPVSPKPPQHWLERVRHGAPQLLRSDLHRNKRALLTLGHAPSAAEKSIAVPQVPEHQPEKQSYPLGPLRETEFVQRPRLEPSDPAFPGTPPQTPTGVPASRSHSKSQQKCKLQPFLAPARPRSSFKAAVAKFPVERVEESPQSSPVSPAKSQTEPAPNRSAGPVERSSDASHEQLWVTVPRPLAFREATSAPQRTQSRVTSLFCVEGPGKAAPSAGPTRIPEPSEDHWPQLPETSAADLLNEPRATIRERERLRRLDDEQRGIYGTRRISA